MSQELTQELTTEQSEDKSPAEGEAPVETESAPTAELDKEAPEAEG